MAPPLVIRSLTFDEVVVPARPGAVDSEETRKPLHMLPVGGKKGWSIQFDALSKLILRLELTNGVVGLGEFYRDHSMPVVREVAESLIGTDLRDLALQDLPIPLCREYDGFECAIWDAFAKALDVPLHALLGGKLRNAAKVGGWSSHRTVAEAGVVAARFQREGYDCIKLKCDLEDDVVAWAAEIARTAPGLKMILDPNQRWENAGEARRRLKGLDKVGNVLLVEDPIPKWMYAEYAELRRVSGIAIVQHISLPYVYQGQRVHDAIACLTHGSVDGFNVNTGLAKFRQLDGIFSAAGVYAWHGSEVDLGILEAMYVHSAVAAPSCVWPSDIFGRMIRSHDLLAEPLRFEPPYVHIPDRGPGLGIMLDEAAIAAHRRDRFVIA